MRVQNMSIHPVVQSLVFLFWITIFSCQQFFLGIAHGAVAPGPDGGGYYSGRTTYDWIDISGTGTEVQLDDEDFSGPINFASGFTFAFYGTSYINFYIQSNGLISFFADSNNAEIIDQDNQCQLPDTNPPANFIALMWDDLDPFFDGNIYYQFFSVGSCPYLSYDGACLVVEYHNIPVFERDLSASTFEAVLLDNNAIIVQFNSSELGLNWGDESTTGIEGQNPASDHGISYACNTAGTLFHGLAVEFSDNPDISYKSDFYWPMFLPAILNSVQGN